MHHLREQSMHVHWKSWMNGAAPAVKNISHVLIYRQNFPGLTWNVQDRVGWLVCLPLLCVVMKVTKLSPHLFLTCMHLYLDIISWNYFAPKFLKILENLPTLKFQCIERESFCTLFRFCFSATYACTRVLVFEQQELQFSLLFICSILTAYFYSALIHFLLSVNKCLRSGNYHDT